MHFYEVFVAEPRYQKLEPLTYQSDEVLGRGALVSVPYGNKTSAGFVLAKVSQPKFKTKSIHEKLSHQRLPEAIINLHEWLLSYYPASSGAITQLFVPSVIKRPKSLSLTAGRYKAKSLPQLTKEQSQALDSISNSKQKTFLIHGETGSGKTRLYLERAKTHLESGKSIIILTPEISLVPQMKQVFAEQFGNKVIEMHSGLTKTKRNKHWLQILESTEPLIIVGTRSATFVPLADVGLIVVDEMHEPAYKQESAPRYNALRAAGKRAQIQSAEILYGSATPPVIEHYLAEQTKVSILRLTKTARDSSDTVRSLVDLKDKNLFSRHSYLSDPLVNALEKRMKSNQQSLLFLNRRGTARQILCQECGWQALCPKCDLPLTLHADKHHIRCHTCGYQTKPPYACPVCNSSNILYRSLGTKALAEDLQRLFPDAKIKRFDTDNLSADTLARNFDSVLSGEVDILVGTQMLGKGLDLPHLTLVGIVNADTSLHMPDFSSAERSYQLLHQAIGRVGRGHADGEVIIQTYQPENPLLTAAIKQDWQQLYQHELSERQQFLFPPFCYLLKLTVSRRTSESAEQYTGKLYRHIRSLGLAIDVQNPVPSFYERSHGKYNWQLIVKARNRQLLVDIVKSLPAGDYVYDLDPSNLL